MFPHKSMKSMREIGIALLFASGLLAFLLFIPVAPRAPYKEPSAPITIATSTAPGAFAQVPLEAKAAIVYDLVTKEVLYAKNADAQLPLASLTKLLTMYPTVPVIKMAELGDNGGLWGSLALLKQKN